MELDKWTFWRASKKRPGTKILCCYIHNNIGILPQQVPSIQKHEASAADLPARVPNQWDEKGRIYSPSTTLMEAVTSLFTVVWQLDFEPEVGGFPFVAVVGEVAEAVYYWIQVPPLPVPLPLPPLVVVAALKFQAQHSSIHQFQPLVVEDRSWCFRCHPFKDFGGLHFHLPVDIL